MLYWLLMITLHLLYHLENFTCFVSTRLDAKGLKLQLTFLGCRRRILGTTWDAIPIVNGIRSLVNMCCNCVLQPRNAAKADKMRADPVVKHTANLEGANMITGRKRVNAKIRKTMPLPSKAAKYASWLAEGIWKLHQNSRLWLLCVPKLYNTSQNKLLECLTWNVSAFKCAWDASCEYSYRSGIDKLIAMSCPICKLSSKAVWHLQNDWRC